jgi:streptogramin lyase
VRGSGADVKQRQSATRRRWRESPPGTVVRWQTTLPLFTVAVLSLLLMTSMAAYATSTSNPGNTFTTDVMDPPSDLGSIDCASITLNWTASGDTYAQGHRILRSASSGGPYVQVAEITPRSTTSHVDSPAAGTYHYVARAFAGNWESADSAEHSATVNAGGSSVDAGGPYSIAEGDDLALDGSGSIASTWEWDLDDDGDYDDASGASPTVSWASLAALGVDDDGVYQIGLRVDGCSTASTSLTIDNTAPSLTTTGDGEAVAGSSYTLNLAASDPGDDTITGWTINWGDGAIDYISSNPASVTHTYDHAGFTYNILAAADDEDGSYLQNELIVPSYDGDTIFRFDAAGEFVQTLASADDPIEAEIGPDGDVYVSGELSDNVVRYDGDTWLPLGEFVAEATSGLQGAEGIAFGPDGNLYVADWGGNQVVRFDGTTGASLGTFASTNLNHPYDVVFGPDGDLYVGNYDDHEVVRFDGATGAFDVVFVTAAAGGLDTPEQMTFGPDGNLYVTSLGTGEVLRFDGSSGASMGVFVSTGGAADLDEPGGLVFGPDGDLYVTDLLDHVVLRFDGATGSFIDEYIPLSSGLTQPALLTFVPEHQVIVRPAPVDLDAVPLGADKCPDAFDIDQMDTDGDGIGDACDPSPTLATSAVFTTSGQTLGSATATGVAVADVDGDGDLDIIYANDGPNTIWLNNGTGTFTNTGQALGNANSLWASLGDFDGDGDVDVTYANDGPNTIWLNNGTGTFTNTGQTLGNVNSAGAAVGDVDGDDDLDIAYANDGDDDTVWLNNGTGTFTNSGQTLGIGRSHAAVLHDLDGDGDLDLAYAGDNQGDTVWLNNGTGTFTNTGAVLGLGHSRSIGVGDLDGDGDADIYLGSHGCRTCTPWNSVWLNNGTGTFTDSGQTLGSGKTEGLAVGDLDGDGDLDVVVANDADPHVIWLNG